MPDAHSVDYDVCKAWRKRHFDSADDCIDFFLSQSTRGRKNAFHGAYRCTWPPPEKASREGIISSLDIHFTRKKLDHHETRKQEETALLKSFVKDADPHLSSGARLHIKMAFSKWEELRTTGTLVVGRHHGLPTRCVDWTDNGLTALFFACRRDFDEDGVVWWMDNDNFTKALEIQWRRVYGKSGNVEDDIEKDFRDGEEKVVFTRLLYPPFMERLRLQQAWITFSMKYGVHHDEELSRLGVSYCGRVVVKASVKRALLEELARLGVTGESLGLGSGCVELIAQDVAKGVRSNSA